MLAGRTSAPIFNSTQDLATLLPGESMFPEGTDLTDFCGWLEHGDDFDLDALLPTAPPNVDPPPSTNQQLSGPNTHGGNFRSAKTVKKPTALRPPALPLSAPPQDVGSTSCSFVSARPTTCSYVSTGAEPKLKLLDSSNTAKSIALVEHCAKRELQIVDPSQKHDLPIARVKRLMKEHSCHDCNAIAVDVPGMLARSIELFVMHTAAQGSLIAIERGRNVLQSRDLKSVLERDEQYAFLQEIYDECSGATGNN